MKPILYAALLGAAVATAAPAPLTPPAPRPAAAPQARPALPPACAERLKQRAERMKKDLGLTDAQAESIRAENERHRAALVAARDAHRAAIDKILTPEQKAKADAKRGEFEERRKARMAQRMERCDDMDDEGDEDDAPVQPQKPRPTR